LKREGLGIIFHSGSYDRIYHGLSLARVALALDREVILFFTHWALEYLRKGKPPLFKLDEEGETYRVKLEENIKKKHLHEISELIIQTKAMGAKLYACTRSMSLLNISGDELIKEVDMSVEIVTFLTNTGAFQMLFI
jgi:peroxiredoxin family protein